MSNENKERAIVEFGPARSQGTLATTDAASARQIAEAQGAMIMAKRFPRDQNDAYTRIMTACKRLSLAEQGIYSYPRGGQRVEGPSIRLAEAMAQSWGNIDFGFVELEQRDGESSVMAYCVDLETNTRQTKVFTVRHERKARGEIVPLNDPRDIYETVSNQAARRMRNCILAVIPGDVVEAAVYQCKATMQGQSSEPIKDRARKMVAAFSDLGVNRGQIEKNLGHKLDTMSETELVRLRKIFASLRDGASSPQQWFSDGNAPGHDPETGETQSTRDELKQEAVRLGLVDNSCRYGPDRLKAMIADEQSRLADLEEDAKAQDQECSCGPGEGCDVCGGNSKAPKLNHEELKAEAVEMGIVDDSCQYGAERLRAMIDEANAEMDEARQAAGDGSDGGPPAGQG